MKTIGIDIDDTITETTLIGNKYLTKFDNSYTDYHDLPPKKYDEFLKLYLEEIIKNNILKPYVLEAFEYLNKHNYQIVIITARNNNFCANTKKLTIDFLAKHKLKYDKIEFDDLNQVNKGVQAQKNGVDLFIDDKEEILNQVAKIGIECIRFTNAKKSKYKTFNNWKDIIEYIKTK